MSEGGAGKAEGPYKIVELATVTDETLEECLNHWASQGYTLDAVHFAMRESSRRPSMAFVVFLRPKPTAS